MDILGVSMISQQQLKILAFPYSKFDCLICDGAVRSGKTSIMVWSFVKWAMANYSERRFGICGKTVGSAIQNIVQPFMSMSYTKETYAIRFRRADKILEIRRGKTVNWFEIFGGRDESSAALIQGRTLAGVLLDEVVLMPESFVNQALARCSVSGARLWFSCNPGNPSHWFKEKWIDKREEHNALYLHFTMLDNPSLNEQTLARYQSMYTGVFYQRYVLGLWVAAEGLVYPMFDMDRHIVDTLPPKMGRFFISIDYGTLNPTAMGLWQIYNGTATMIKEYYYSGRDMKKQKTDEEYYADLEKFADGCHIERCIIDPSAASFRECIRRHGKFAVWGADNSVLDGIRLTGTLLNAGRLKFHKSCENTFAEFTSYVWDEEAGEDAVIKEKDHSMDQMRYFCQTIMRREVRATGV